MEQPSIVRQLPLAIPRLKKKETRQALLQIFEGYRRASAILKVGVVQFALEDDKVEKKYEDAQIPGTIRAQNRYNSHTENAAFKDEEAPWKALERFVRVVDTKVRNLHPYRRDIIKRRYLYEDHCRAPSDHEVYEVLYNEGWYVGLRYFEEEKSEAMLLLAYAFNIEQLELPSFT